MAAEMRGHDDGRRCPRAMYATREQLARRYQMSVRWVDKHADELGATPVSDSPNSKLRFDLAVADAYMASRRRQSPGKPRRRPSSRARRRPARTASGAPLVDFV
jgi:hypothetical protein